jgi:hypothetical protein
MIKYFFIALFLFLNSLLFSQTDSSKLKIEASLAGNATVGNFGSQALILRNNLEWNFKKLELSWSPKFQISQISTNGVYKLREREIYSTFSLTGRNKNWKLLFFNEIEHTYLRKIDLRTSLGLGFGKKLIKNKEIELDISEVLLPEFTISQFGKQYDNLALRSSTRLKFVWTKNIFKFSSITLFQPSLLTYKNGGQFIEFKDNINLRNVNNIEINPMKWVSFGVGNEIIYQSYPNYVDPLIKPIDWIFFFSIKYKN